MITGNVWSFVYHKFLGLCHTFSLGQAEDLNIDEPVWLSFILKPYFVYPFWPYGMLPYDLEGVIFMHREEKWHHNRQCTY